MADHSYNNGVKPQTLIFLSIHPNTFKMCKGPWSSRGTTTLFWR